MRKIVCICFLLSDVCNGQSNRDSTAWLVFTRLLSVSEVRVNLGVARVDKYNRSLILETFYQTSLRNKLSSEYLSLFSGLKGYEAIVRYRWPLGGSGTPLYFSAGVSYSDLSGRGFVDIQEVNKPGSISYDLSQRRRMAGARFQLSYCDNAKKSPFEFWIGSATYFAFTENQYHAYASSGTKGLTAVNIPEIRSGLLKEGFSILPRFNLGVALRLQLTPIGRSVREAAKRNRENETHHSAHYLKIYPLSFLANRYAFSYETIINNSWSLEIQPKLIFPSSVLDGISNFFLPNIRYLNKGFELMGGISAISSSTGELSRTHGLFLSYRYQHVGNRIYWTGGISGSGAHTEYHLSQTKHLAGLFYKGSLFELPAKLTIDFYWQLGFYVFRSRTVVFWSYGPYRDLSEPMGPADPSGLFRPNGVGVMPVIKFGIAPRYRISP